MGHSQLNDRVGGMLGSLLPGLRDLGAPLAAADIWLGIFWLAWGRDQTNLQERQDVVGDIYRLAQDAGPVAIGSSS